MRKRSRRAGSRWKVSLATGLIGLALSSTIFAVRAENTASNGGCDATYLNSPQVLDWLNSSIGQRRGFPSRVGSVGEAVPANSADLFLLGLPGTDDVALGGHPAMIACHVKVVLQNGLQRSGILDVIAPSHKFFSPGASQSLTVAFAPDEVIESVRQQQVATKERDLQQQRATLQQQREAMENASNQNACYQGWKIAIEAKSLLNVEPTNQVVADLENRYAYGPNGELYRDSQDAAAMIRHITAAVQMSPEERQARGVPDYTSQTFLHSCPSLMSRQSN